MYSETEKKILDAALKIFAERGYVAATTKSIADASGFTEMTLFRKFKTKKNLYEMVLAVNIEKVKIDFFALLSDDEFENPEEFLRNLIKGFSKAIENNYEFIHLVMQVKSETYSPIFEEFQRLLAENLARNIKNDKIDYIILALTITDFLYIHSLNERVGNFNLDFEKGLEGFVKNTIQCVCK